MVRRKRGDTLARSIERVHGIDLNIRSDAKLKNILRKRGFDSQSQLVAAAKGQAKRARKRRCFISFHREDLRKVNGLRLMAKNPGLALDFYDGSVRFPVNSEKASYIRKKIKLKITAASVLICVVGNATGWRDWVDWELRTALSLGKGICAVRIPGTYGSYPEVVRLCGAAIASWDADSIAIAIEQAAALRS